MAADRSEMFMWEQGSPPTLHQMKDHILRSMAHAPLTVHIPRRNVKVPQLKSKKYQQLQSKPRDPNASHSLLMIAPPSDCRYRYFMRNEHRKMGADTAQERQSSSHHNVTQSQQIQALSSQQQQQQQRLMQATQWLDGQGVLNGSGMPGPGYFQQLSTIAAMAWSDCSQATEKLRRIYEQTSILSRDPFSVMAPYASSPYVATPNIPSDLSKPQEFTRLPPPEVAKSAVLKQQAELLGDRYWEMPSVYCACAVCEMTKRTKSSMTSQRRGVTSHVNTSELLMAENRTYPPVAANQEAPRLKRSRSPDLSTNHHPPRKMNRQEHGPATNGALLSYLKSKTQSKLSESSSHFAPNIFFPPPSLQLPVSSYPTPSSNPRDLMITPSFENQCFVNTQVVNGNGGGGGIYNGFTNFLPPKILNALE